MDGTILEKKLGIAEKLAQLNEIAQQIEDIPTFTSNDRAFLEELPGFPATDGKKVLTATTESGETSLQYEEMESGGDYTAGDYINITAQNVVNVTLTKGSPDTYSYKFITTSTSDAPRVKIQKYINGVFQSETTYNNDDVRINPVNVDGMFSFTYGVDGYYWQYTLLRNSNEHNMGAVVRWFYQESVNYEETFTVYDENTTLATKGDLNAIKNAIINANDFAAAQAALSALNSVRVVEEAPAKKTRSKK